ncbi:MAG TPA: hypothetical protein VF691_20510 [Cytophagaceae bacterium]|jgi:hypothetical protein
MPDININLSEEELARLIQNEEDPIRKSELLQLLSGEETETITINNVNILGANLGRVDYDISTLKCSAVVSVHKKYHTLTESEITQIFDLIQTFPSLNTPQDNEQSDT